MSANFWGSSQRLHWQFSRKDLQASRSRVRHNEIQLGVASNDNDSILSAADPNIKLYIHSLIQQLGRPLQLRQRVMATAELYTARFFTKVSIHEVNLYLLVAACVYVACKAEESSQHIRTVSSEARALWPEFITQDPTKIAECEFYLIEELDTYLIVHHPYKSLSELSQSLTGTNAQLALRPEELQSAWSMINDSYATDVLLLYAPHIIATACIYITIVLKSPHIRPTKPPEKIKARIDMLSTWMGDSGIDLIKVTEVVQEMVSLYARWEHYDEAACRTRLSKHILGHSNSNNSNNNINNSNNNNNNTNNNNNINNNHNNNNASITSPASPAQQAPTAAATTTTTTTTTTTSAAPNAAPMVKKPA